MLVWKGNNKLVLVIETICKLSSIFTRVPNPSPDTSPKEILPLLESLTILLVVVDSK